ncbi:MAG: hypothetical protein JWP44_3731 [Mucilaginibacter sp.]|nr:hypothetical protein [Mucilaginibacter sp.]
MKLRKVSDEEKEQIKKLLSLDEDRLFSLLPHYDDSYTEVFFMTEGEIKAGKKVFEKLSNTIKHKVCNEWKACQKIKDSSFDDEIVLVAALGDVIATAIIKVPPFIIATLLIKIGVRNFCNCNSKKKH